MAQPINISFSRTNSVAHPQSQTSRLRRESIAHSQGMGGVSWGSVGIGSWLRDEVFHYQQLHQNIQTQPHLQPQQQQQNQTQHQSQQQSRPLATRRQSINLLNGNFTNNNAMDLRNDSVLLLGGIGDSSIPNSSYLADLEANYCKDYSCCGQLLPTLHDLLKHYEEMHIESEIPGADQSILQSDAFNTTLPNNIPIHNHQDLTSTRNNNSVGAVPTNEVFLNNHLNTKSNVAGSAKTPFNSKVKTNSNPATSNFNLNLSYDHMSTDPELQKTLSNFNFDQPTDHDTGNDHDQHHDHSQFDFGGSASNIFQSNDLVKDIENQAKMFHQHIEQQLPQQQSDIQQQQQQQHNFQVQNQHQQHFGQQFPQAMYSHQKMQQNALSQTHAHKVKKSRKNNGHAAHTETDLDMNMDLDMDLDAPFQMDVEDTTLGANANGTVAGIVTDNGSSNGHVHGNSKKAATIATSASNVGGVPAVGTIDNPARRLYVMEQRDERPFQCPVIGCDKTYKNQNGLKYHRIHGHTNQTLRENPDGTISVINPDSDSPYPNGMGFEKDKPYRCEVCGKRYKNLNGLKYHRGHTTH